MNLEMDLEGHQQEPLVKGSAFAVLSFSCIREVDQIALISKIDRVLASGDLHCDLSWYLSPYVLTLIQTREDFLGITSNTVVC